MSEMIKCESCGELMNPDFGKHHIDGGITHKRIDCLMIARRKRREPNQKKKESKEK